MTDRFRLLIATGEVSGDLQGSLLVRALHAAASERDWHLEIDALGGPRMQQSGVTLLADTTRLSAIGSIESLPFIKSALTIQQQLKQHLIGRPPDLTVLIDYPGFNVPLARYLKRHCGCPIVYYIAPQEWVWAFGKGTTRQIANSTDEILAIFSQEAQYYADHGASATWIGHPFVDTLTQLPTRDRARDRLGIPPQQKAIALLPASRSQELRYILPVLAEAAQQIQARVPEVRFWIPVALPHFRESIQAVVDRFELKASLTEDPHLVLAAADLSIGKSGTANLEAALLNVPQIAVYRIHPFNGWLYRKLLRFQVPYISPVNLVQNATVVPELLQEAVTPQAITRLALELLQPSLARMQMLQQYQQLRTQLGPPGAIQRAATAILNRLAKTRPTPAPYLEDS
ncbi:lipid-A-disaccharide synthase [Altericista sp. CCNU0014]|uniref:lipid-A-disaccharide synthase n=1 Tax=Altericista sp. CCNU0014 TaxID=3082949 RepID=UPI00384E8B71